MRLVLVHNLVFHLLQSIVPGMRHVPSREAIRPFGWCDMSQPIEHYGLLDVLAQPVFGNLFSNGALVVVPYCSLTFFIFSFLFNVLSEPTYSLQYSLQPTDSQYVWRVSQSYRGRNGTCMSICIS
jgi:hypothetical protein